MKSIHNFLSMKQNGDKITMVTCYDAWSANIINESPIDCILIGDSAAMVMHGHDSTLPATVDMMAWHTAAVRKGAPLQFLIADMPFLSHRKSLDAVMAAVQTLMQHGANAIKLEGASGNEEIVEHITQSGVPVMGHLGLTPQSLHGLGGFKVQAKQAEEAKQLLAHAKALEAAGCFAIVLECIPAKLADMVSQSLTIPTIGIGAGAGTDGQVLVLQDLLGMDDAFKPKFLKQYLNGKSMIEEALSAYVSEVKEGAFPGEEHSYT